MNKSVYTHHVTLENVKMTFLKSFMSYSKSSRDEISGHDSSLQTHCVILTVVPRWNLVITGHGYKNLLVQVPAPSKRVQISSQISNLLL